MRPAAAGRVVCLWAALVLAGAAGPAQASLFADDEARRAILDLRQKALDTQKAQTQQHEALRSTLLDLQQQIEAMRQDLAQLRGHNETLARDLADLQKRQRDLDAGVHSRLERLEPQTVDLDGRRFSAHPEEIQAFDAALTDLRAGQFAASLKAFQAFQTRYPQSGYLSSVAFWVGNAQYALKNYKEALAAFRQVIRLSPQGALAPEAWLSLANAHLALQDTKSARKAYEDLLRLFPESEAAATAQERLAALKG
jgi:tol-pal system protein YbgF